MTDLTNTVLDGRYRLVRRIGQGGFGDVWMATDSDHNAEVAVKLLDVSDTSARGSRNKIERFRREAMTLGRIRHENVVTIYDVGLLPQQHLLYMVMELLSGHNLETELMLSGGMDSARGIARVVEGLRGLEASHAAGVVHKDIKPGNLFLHQREDGREVMKLIDFGIARMDSLTKLTATGRMTGSPRYMAPEYILGREVSQALDVYQMALILAEALSGEPCIPRGLQFMEVCQRHVLGKIELSPRLLQTPLGPVLRRATARQPSERYQTAAEFAAALEAIDPATVGDLETARTVRMVSPFEDVVPTELTVDDIETLQDLSEQFDGVAASTDEAPLAASGPIPVPTGSQRKRRRGPPYWVWAVVLGVLAGLLLVQVLRPPPPPPPTTIGECLLHCTEVGGETTEVQKCERMCRQQFARAAQ